MGVGLALTPADAAALVCRPGADLRELLPGQSDTNLSSSLHFSINGTSMTIQVSSTGAFNDSTYGAATDRPIVLEEVNLFSCGWSTDQQNIQDLLKESKLVVDGWTPAAPGGATGVSESAR